MRILMSRLATAALFGASVFSGDASAAPGLDAYALTAGGNSLFGANGVPFACATFGPDSAAGIFGGTLQMGLPTDGSVCGVGSQRQVVSATAGWVQAAAPLAVGWGKSPDLRTFTGDARARAGFGELGVRAASSYTGASDSGTVAGSQAGARQVEVMTFGGGVASGTYRPTFTIDGALFDVGRAQSEIEVSYSSGSGAPVLAFRIMSQQGGGLSFYANGGYQATLPGMSVTGDLVNGFTVAGQTTFSVDIPIVFGVAQEVGFNLWAATIPRSNVGLLTPSGGDAGFLNTVKLTGIQVFDSSGAAVNDFSITAGSGTLYGAGGVIAVPEPGTAWLLCTGVLGLLLLRRRV